MWKVYKDFVEEDLAIPVVDGKKDGEREVRRRAGYLYNRGADA